MILAPNLRLPLSGNNRLILLALAALLTLSCSSSKPTAVTVDLTPIITEKPVQDTVKAIIPESVLPEEIKKDTIVEKKTPAKTHYNIAVVLTYNTDQVPLNYSPFAVDTSLFLSQETQQSLDFYMGLKLAVDDFRNTELPVNIFILDDGMRPSKIKELLLQRPFPDVDLIIGPGREFNLPPLLEFASKTEIPIISPFITDVSVANASPRLYTATPSMRTLISRQIDYFQQQFPEKKLLVIWDPADDSSRLLAELSSAYIYKQYGYSPVMVPFRQGETDLAEGHIWLTDNPDFSQAVIIASTRELFVRYLLGKLSNYTQQLFIIGMPHWSYMKLTETGNQFPHVMVISDDGYALPGSTAFKVFSDKFINEFTRVPVATSVLGYDLGNYILEVLSRNMIQTMPSSKNLNLSPLKYTFDFTKQRVAENSPAYIMMNTDVGILKWQFPKFIRVK
jgi:hypothetical protein